MQPPVHKDQSSEAVARRLRRCFEMYQEGVQITRARLRRQHPGASREEIARLLNQWLHEDTQTDGKYLVPSPCPRFCKPS